VNAPGRYPLEPGMHVTDLIRAGGSLVDSAYGGEAELTRYEIVNGIARQTELIPINLAAVRRGDAGADVQLKPYDVLLIKVTPQWEEPGNIILAGEVRFPGKYPIHRGETLSSVLRRAGGFTDLAFIEGAVFIREELKQRERDQLDLLANRLQSDLTALSLEVVSSSTLANNGNGAAGGSGNGTGNGGNGTGSGGSGGVGNGSGTGSGSPTKPTERIFVPGRPVPGQTENEPTPLGPGQDVPLTPYTQVIQSYRQAALDATNRTLIPVSASDLIRMYFSSLSEPPR